MIFSLKGQAKQYTTRDSVQHHIDTILTNTTVISEIDLSSNIFFEDALIPLCLAIKKIKNLKKLTISNIFMLHNKEQMRSCLDIIIDSITPEKLEHFDISDNAISCEFTDAFSTFLSKLTNLNTLYISNCGLGCDGGAKLATLLLSLDNKRNLQILDISNNKLTSAGKDIGLLVSKFMNLNQLYMQFNTMDTVSMFAFLEAISETRLSILDIRDNKVDSAGCKLLGGYLYNWNILSCKLGDCGLGDAGMFELTTSYNRESMYSMFRKWNKRKERFSLDISYNDLSDKVYLDLCTFVGDREINVINVTGNDFEDLNRLHIVMEAKGGQVIVEDDESSSEFSDSENEESELIQAFDAKINLDK